MSERTKYRNAELERVLVTRDRESPEDAADQYDTGVTESASMYLYDKTPPDELLADEFSLEPDAEGAEIFFQHVFAEVELQKEGKNPDYAKPIDPNPVNEMTATNAVTRGTGEPIGDRTRTLYPKDCFCGKKNPPLMVRPQDNGAWLNGTLAQKAFPYLTADERETLISGICPECWKAMFSE